MGWGGWIGEEGKENMMMMMKECMGQDTIKRVAGFGFTLGLHFGFTISAGVFSFARKGSRAMMLYTTCTRIY